MKIRHRWLIKGLGFAGAWVVRAWISTLRYRCHRPGSSALPYHPDVGGYYIYAFWHENMLVPAYHCGRPDVSVLVSQHADGQLMAEVCRRLGFKLIRGSTTRGSIEAVRQMVRAGSIGHLAITPDGPRGPRRQVQPGVIYLAAKTGLPIIAGGFGYQNPWRLRSWDQFVLPRPLRRARVILAEPIRIPPELDKDLLEHYRRLLEDMLNELNDAAERWANKGGRRPSLANKVMQTDSDQAHYHEKNGMHPCRTPKEED